MEWDDARIVTPVEGIHRHIVRFVVYGGGLYAFKELPPHVATREYGLLRALDERAILVVDAVGVVSGRTDDDGEPLDSILITRHLDYSLPYRSLFLRASMSELWAPLLDSLAQLLVRLHLAGFFWGDCSLSNALFRRDAGALSATLVDAETGEMHDELSIGQRNHDLTIAEVNVAGELLDVAMGGGWQDEFDPAVIAEDLVARYESLWHELKPGVMLDAADAHGIDIRVRRLNDLGFDVSEVVVEESDDGFQLRFRTAVVEAGHHSRLLLSLTGLDVQENQARRLLNDIRRHRADLERTERRPMPENLAAMRWMSEIFSPTIGAIPPDLGSKLEPAEMYHQILEHRWFASERQGSDVGMEEALNDYVATVLASLPDELHVIVDDDLSGNDLLGDNLGDV